MEDSIIGKNKTEIDTPALLVDLDKLDKNIETMAEYYRKKSGVLRPHAKGHRSPIIAKKQMDAGAIGISVSTLGLTEVMINSGIDDILLTNQIVSRNKIERLIGLSKHANITLGVEDIQNIELISKMAERWNRKVDLGIEVDMGRSGVKIGTDTEKMAEKIANKYDGVNFKGIWWHDGNLSSMKSLEERRKKHFQTMKKIAETKKRIEELGIPVNMLSGGYTCTWNITPEFEELSNVEVQAGNYVFHDWPSNQLEGLSSFNYALTVLTRVTSRPSPKRATIDASLHVCSNENSHNYREAVGPQIREDIGKLKSIYLCEENGKLKFENPNNELKIGDTLELIPPHADTTAKLNDRYYGTRNGKVEVIWNNVGRGAI